MIRTIAWRNVWRNPGRSLVVILAVFIGIWALVFAIAFMNSFYFTYLDNSIASEYSHLQIHHPEYKKDKEIKYNIPDHDQVKKTIRSYSEVNGISCRTIVAGMISSPKSASGIMAYGIDPDMEANVTKVDSSIVEGDYFESIKRNPILISTNLADRLKVDVRSKIVLTFQDIQGDLVAGSFRITGMFDVLAPRINENVVYVKKRDLQRLTGTESKVHEIAILLNDIEEEPPFTDYLKKRFPDLSVESWKELAPELDFMQSSINVNMTVIVTIIMLALGFGIVNTMLMAVLERFKEIGMLKAVGMQKLRVFKMILLETIMLCSVGGPFGLLAGFLTILYFNKSGLDLSQWSEGLKEWGYASILYPEMRLIDYIAIVIGVILTALLASIYPAIKAVNLKPIEALHKI